jgi:hypothetical protein
MNDENGSMFAKQYERETFRLYCLFLIRVSDEVFPESIFTDEGKTEFINIERVAEAFRIMMDDGWSISLHVHKAGPSLDFYHNTALCIEHDFQTTFEDAYKSTE